MITVISPAKTLDFEPSNTTKHTTPAFLDDSSTLAEVMRKKTSKDLTRIMGISPKLAQLNVDRYRKWSTPFDLTNAKQAVLAFKGDVYLGLEAENYSARDLNFAQKHLRILSGLYGLLKPLDLIQPYRLEMGTKLVNPRGKDLYAFWRDVITPSLNEELATQRGKCLVNLASNEYFKSVDTASLAAPVITPIFKDYTKGSYRVLSFFAKKARGLMASFIVRNRINRVEELKEFDIDGYGYSEDFSAEDRWVFIRKS